MHVRPEFPLPDVDWPETREFFAAAARGELAVPRCDACRRYVWYPTGTCRFCGSQASTWTVVGGRGRLFSWSVVRRAFIPQFEVPYVTGLVTIEEDVAVRIVTRIVDCDPEDLRIDMPVQAVFRPLRFPGVAGEVVVPLFVVDTTSDGQAGRTSRGA
jgi:uncharacterized OB-fold protein